MNKVPNERWVLCAGRVAVRGLAVPQGWRRSKRARRVNALTTRKLGRRCDDEYGWIDTTAESGDNGYLADNTAHPF